MTLRHGADYVLLATDGAEPVAKAYSTPFAFGVSGREELPDAGWDEVVRWQHADRLAGRDRAAATALEIVVLKERQGTGLASMMVKALRDTAFRLGHDVLYAPARLRDLRNRAAAPARRRDLSGPLSGA